MLDEADEIFTVDGLALGTPVTAMDEPRQCTMVVAMIYAASEQPSTLVIIINQVVCLVLGSLEMGSLMYMSEMELNTHCQRHHGCSLSWNHRRSSSSHGAEASCLGSWGDTARH